MRVCANLPPAARDVRLDLFRGLANWAIFLDHIPHEVLSWITTRNYGFILQYDKNGDCRVTQDEMKRRKH